MSDLPGRTPACDPKNGTVWTAELVKERLPKVTVRVGEDFEPVECDVSGRLLRFAKVTLPAGGTVEVTWSTLAHVLNSGGAVTI